ncbi:MAG: RNA-guided endonuclease InsQ/TnpB family protein [Xenococcaceae cyanobacterium]
MILRQAFKFRLEPKARERQLFAQFAGCCRLVWNKALAIQKELLEEGELCLSYSKLAAELKDWKHEEGLTFLGECHSQPLQQTLMNLDRALKEAFNKTNPKQFPRFKKKGQRDSFRYPQGFKIDEPNSRVYLPKIGWVRYRKSQSIVGSPKNVTVSKRGDHWYVSIQTEAEVEQPKTEATSMVGCDLGIARFLTLSTGEYFEPLNSFKKLEKKLARLQRTLARRIKGSENWKKTKGKITNLHIRIANARKDYLHKLSHTLSKNHAVVVLEDLKVANMSKSAKGTVEEPGTNVKAKSGLNKSILDQGWYEFKRQLGYKLEWLGGMLVLVNPKNTSRCCPHCGHTSGENRKTQASFVCVECGYKENADFVGALNVLRAGHARLACGDIDLVVGLAQESAQMTMLA